MGCSAVEWNSRTGEQHIIYRLFRMLRAARVGIEIKLEFNMFLNNPIRALALGVSALTLAGAPALISQVAAHSPVKIENPHQVPQQPFIGFNAKGTDWRMQIRKRYGANNDVQLRLNDGSEWRGTLRYGGSVLDASSNFVVLSGEVRNGLAMLPITVEITLDQRCKVKGSRSMNRVTLYGAGDQPLRACGNRSLR